MDPPSYIEIIPKELGIELLNRMTTKQGEQLLKSNPLVHSRYSDDLMQKFYREQHIDPKSAEQYNRLKPATTTKRQRILPVSMNPRATKFMNLPYIDEEGRGYYSVDALSMWTDLFVNDN